MNAIPKTSGEFARMTADYARHLREDAAFCEIVNVLCGSPDAAQAFADARGVTMAAFARMVELPASTVRHYQRLGLITPYEVNGKFRFWFHNVAQVESVRQWRDLGLSLEEILEQRTGGRIGGQAATFPALGESGLPGITKSMSVLITSRDALQDGLPGGDWQLYVERARMEVRAAWQAGGAAKNGRVLITSSDVFSSGPADLRDWQRSMERTRVEVRAARAKLEERLTLLQQQLRRARTLEAALEGQTTGQGTGR